MKYKDIKSVKLKKHIAKKNIEPKSLEDLAKKTHQFKNWLFSGH